MATVKGKEHVRDVGEVWVIIRMSGGILYVRDVGLNIRGISLYIGLKILYICTWLLFGVEYGNVMLEQGKWIY